MGEAFFVRLLLCLLVTILLKGVFIMKELIFKMVQAQIGYKFKNLDLLKQAFIRRSYTEENGGENNEVLEFIGDKALDFAVVRLLTQKFGHMVNGDPINGIKLSVWEQERHRQNSVGAASISNEFICDCKEGELTKIKSRMVEKRNLARRMDELGFARHLIMGNSDIHSNVQEEMSVKEDLFEAIIGAVALDCGWDFSIITSVAEAMLVPEEFLQNDTETNYVRLIQEWEQKKGVIPWYWFKEESYELTWYISFDGISQNFPVNYDYSKLNFCCELKLLDSLPIFRGFGSSKSEARMNVCKLAYEYLQEHDLLFSIQDEIEHPNKADAINQLEILARRGYFSIPIYDFELKYDSDGNPIWRCECYIEEYDTHYCSKSSSKKDAKKSAAFKMLKYVLSEEE